MWTFWSFCYTDPEGVECEDENGMLPLHSAVRNGCSLKVIKMLVEAYPESLSVEGKFGRLPLHLAVVNYSGEGDFEILKFMLEQYPEGIEEEDSEGNLPLHCAIMNSDFSVKTLEFLLKAYQQGAQVKNKEGNLPLHIAIQCGLSLEFVKLLVEAYAEGVTMKNNEKQLPLHEVVYCHPDIVYSKKRDEGYCDVELLNYMLEVYKAGAKRKDQYGWLPLHTAIYENLSPEIVKILISAYKEGLSVKTDEAVSDPEHFGNLPLHSACQCKSSQDIVRILLTEYPEGVTTKNGYRELPLHLACQHENSAEVIKMLLEEYRGGDKVNDDRGWLPLHNACARRTKLNLHVLNLLVEFYPEGIFQKNNDGDDSSNLLIGQDASVIHRIDGDALARLTSQHVKIACALREAVVGIFSPHLVKLLIKASPESCMTRDQKGRTPLHHACASNALGSLDIVLVLLEASEASFMIPDIHGMTPSKLLSNVASQKNGNGMLPLHRHARYSERFTVSALRQLFNAYPKGIEERDNRGILPFHHACLNAASSVDTLMALLQLYPESITVVESQVPSTAVTKNKS